MPRLVTASEIDQNSEFELLCACCGALQRVSQALGSALQWDRVFKQATYHHVLPALYAAFHPRTDVPASVQSALRARYLRHCQRVMRFSAELARVLQHFEARGVPVIAQKGPALAQFLYGDSAMREFGDLDLLVRPKDVPRAVSALTQLDYEKKLQLSPRQEKAYLQSGYEYVFGRGVERNLIEIQWNLLPRFYAMDVDIDALFARSQAHDFDGSRVRMLGLEDQFIFLCVHAAKHQWAQLGMIRDIAALAEFHLDWEFVLVEARRLGMVRMLVISLLLTNEVLGYAVPEPVAHLPEIGAAKRILPGILERLQQMHEIPPESYAYFRLMLRVRERRSDQAKFLWRLAFTPSVSEWSALQIPDRLFVAYRGVRLLRLLRRFGT